MLTFTNATRCLFVFAIFLLPQSTAFSAELCGSFPTADQVKSPVELVPREQGASSGPVVDMPTDESLPMQVEKSPRAEMFAAHNSIERWRKALAKAIAIDENVAPMFDSSIRALQTRTNCYALNPPFIEPEHLQVPTREDRGEPVSRSLPEQENPHSPY
jgi:hypothetical protein